MVGFKASPTGDYQQVASLANMDLAAVLERVQQGNQPYLAHLRDTPVAYGWSASKEVIVEVSGMAYFLPPAERYLWDFVTLPQWRGQGIYPRLLQAILEHEEAHVNRFWIGHDAPNVASGRGILKAGFQWVVKLVGTLDGSFKIIPVGSPERALVSPFGRYFGLVPTGEPESEQE
jgi:GNAT superfamily N-acetyltransferase